MIYRVTHKVDPSVTLKQVWRLYIKVHFVVCGRSDGIRWASDVEVVGGELQQNLSLPAIMSVPLFDHNGLSLTGTVAR